MDILTITRDIHAPIDEVWAVTSSFGTLQAWMPMVQKVAITGAGIGAIRRVTLASGTADEHLLEADAQRHRMRYALIAEVTSQFEGLVGGTDLVAVDAATTRLTWIVTAEKASGDLQPVVDYLSLFINSCIDGLAAFLKTTAGPAV